MSACIRAFCWAKAFRLRGYSTDSVSVSPLPLTSCCRAIEACRPGRLGSPVLYVPLDRSSCCLSHGPTLVVLKSHPNNTLRARPADTISVGCFDPLPHTRIHAQHVLPVCGLCPWARIWYVLGIRSLFVPEVPVGWSGPNRPRGRTYLPTALLGSTVAPLYSSGHTRPAGPDARARGCTTARSSRVWTCLDRRTP